MDLLIFFAIPLATILLTIVLQKVLRSPILVAITFFAIYLIIAFAFFTETLAEAIIAVIIYTIIAYITAYIVMIICRLRYRFCDCQREEAETQRRCLCNNSNNTENNLLRISCSCGNSERSSDLLTVDSTCMADDVRKENREVDFTSNENLLTNNQYVRGTQNYGNIRCYRKNK